MTRKKSRKKQAPTKTRIMVPKTFDCPFCAHSKSVEYKVLRSNNTIGKISCSKCGASYQTKIHPLIDPVDIFCEWIDKAEEENVELLKEGESTSKPADVE